MRQISYRVWDNFHTAISEPKFWYSDDIGLPKFFEWLAQHNPEAANNTQQWLGILDRNGKKVYEGDIVTFRPKSNKGPFYQICYHISSYVLKDKKGRILEYDDYEYDDYGNYGPVPVAMDEAIEIRVVGNIYENPELLQ